jgi:hypothetical protein
MGVASDLDTHEQAARSEAATLLAALPVAKYATEMLSSAIEGATIPAAPVPTPPSWYVRAATGLLAIIGLRTARGCILLVESAYWPEAQALKRRLSEVHARAQACGRDETGEHAHLWLEHKAPGVGKLIHKFGNKDAWEVYNWGAHADARSVHAWMTTDIDQADAQGILVMPEHEERLSNALLVEVGMECRDMAMVQAVARAATTADVDSANRVMKQLDNEIDAARRRWYVPIEPDG